MILTTLLISLSYRYGLGRKRSNMLQKNIEMFEEQKIENIFYGCRNLFFKYCLLEQLVIQVRRLSASLEPTQPTRNTKSNETGNITSDL